MRTKHSLLALAAIVTAAIIAAWPTATRAQSPGPLVVDENSHVVAIEYEAWFGPDAVTFQGTAAVPLLSSADMKKAGLRGYDSADPAVIQQHVAWMEYMGVAAAVADLTNNVSCIFNSEQFAEKYLPNCTPAFRIQNQNIRNNTGNLYPAWSMLGTQLKLIPLLDGADQDVLFKDIDGTTSFEKEVNYFGALMSQHPDLQVIYEGKPLMVIFLGAAQDPNRLDNPLWFQIRQFLKNHPEIGLAYTFKLMAGYLDSQPGLWAAPNVIPSAPVEMNPEYDFWSWVDRLNATCTGPYCPYYPSYNKVGSRVENLTASIATAGQNGWGCPNEEAPPTCPDDALRFGDRASYITFDAFMAYADALQPIFLFIHQFNEFVPPDEGFNANTDDDIEPSDLWGTTAIQSVKNQIATYRGGNGVESVRH
jgi:hypothetical protein